MVMDKFIFDKLSKGDKVNGYTVTKVFPNRTAIITGKNFAALISYIQGKWRVAGNPDEIPVIERLKPTFEV